MKKNYLFFAFLISIIQSYLYAQSLANYSTVRNTGVGYATIVVNGNAFGSWRNTTSFTQDDNRSDFTDIGFDFWYNGVRYTKFCVSTNGYLDFSNSTANGGPTAGAFGYLNDAFTTSGASTSPAITPFYDDLTAQGGVSALGNSVKYELTGTAPNRTLTVEWINMAVFGNTSPSLNFQVKLVEGLGNVFINYGLMNSGTNTFSYSMGLNAEVLSAVPTLSQLKELQTVNLNSFSNVINDNLSVMPAANSQYVFTPIVPTAAAGAITFNAVTQTGMTINWPNWATNEVGYVLYNSTDNINFNFVTQTAINATSSVITGLLPSTTYYWRLFAVTEGCLSAALNGSQITLNAGNKISIASGTWNTANTWSPNGVPTGADNVTISNGHTVTINVNSVCNNLTIGQGSSGVLSIGNSNISRTAVINGSISINSGATFNVNTASNTTHNLSFPGNLINNGSLNFATDLNSLCNVIFNKNGNQTISGSGATTRFNLITLNMGTSINNTLDIQTPNFIAPTNFLTLTNGTFKLSTSGVSNLTLFTTASIVPQNGAIWLNSVPSTINTLASLTMFGDITVSNGIFNVGNVANMDLISNGGNLTILNGTLNIAGKYYADGINILSKFTMSGGIVLLPSIGSTNTTIAPFHITGAGSQFNMSGGSLIIPREGGSGAQDLGFTNTGASGGSVTGGTLQIGSSSSPLGQIININTTFPVGNLLINSSNVNATLLTNSLSVTNDVSINSGTLTANNLDLSLGKNWANNGGEFLPGTGSVNFIGTASQTIFKTGGEIFNNISFSNLGVKTLLSPIRANDLTINTGSNLDITASNQQITLLRNYTNNGIFNSRNGLVFLNGTTAQSIAGTTVTDFYNLTLNNNAGASITASGANLIETLNLNNGVFNTNAKLFTMISNITGTARIAQITGTGNIIGNVTVQRFAPGGTTGWALLGAPISSALTYSDWDDNLFISCASCPDGSAAGFESIYTYNEPAVGSYSNAVSYIPLTGITDPIQSTKGYWLYLGSGFGTTTNIMFDVVGTVNKFNIPINLSVTNTGAPLDDGWNLISNPYPSAISWAALKGTTLNIDDAIYGYNADLNGGTGAQTAYVNGISSPAIGSGGIGDVIPMCQGFYVHSTGATVLSASESNKIIGNPTYLRTSSVSSISIPQLLRLQLDGPFGFSDESTLYIQNGADDYFDEKFDALKLAGQDPYAPTIALEKGSTVFQINGISPISGSFSMPLKTLTAYSNTYTISLQDFSNFPIGACVNLYDKFLGLTTNLKLNNYVFNLSDTTSVARFDLNITVNPLNINSLVNQTSCSSLHSGKIIANGISAGPWNYYWKDNSGIALRTKLNKFTSDTLSGLFGGSYNLEVNTVGMCDNGDKLFNIDTQEIPVSSFTSLDTINLNITGLIHFNNSSINSSYFNWNFGNGIGNSVLTSPNYTYDSVGVFMVTLISESSTGCVDTSFKSVVVINNNITNVATLSNLPELIIKNIDNNEYELVQSFKSNETISYSLIDATGKLILSKDKFETTKLIAKINLNSYSKGIYFFNLLVGGKQTTIKLVNQ